MTTDQRLGGKSEILVKIIVSYTSYTTQPKESQSVIIQQVDLFLLSLEILKSFSRKKFNER